MATMNLVSPQKLKAANRKEHALKVSALLLGEFGLPGVSALSGIGRLAFNAVLGNGADSYGELSIDGDRLRYAAGDSQTDIALADVKLAEFHYYDHNDEGWHDSYPGPTLLVHHGDIVTTSHTLDSRKNCAHFLKELYATGIPLRDYMNGRRSYLLKHPLYKEVQALKARYGADFW